MGGPFGRRIASGIRISAVVRLRAWVVAAAAAGVVAVAVAAAGPGAAHAASSSAVTRAVAYLRAAQNRDGGLGAAPGQPSAQLFAGWGALGLASAGVDIGSLRRAAGDPTLLAYVRTGLGARDPGSLERSILVLRAAGVPATGPADDLARRVSARGSVGGLVNLTAFALLALRAADAPGTAAAQARARRWLTGEADRDGGYGYGGRGSGSDADDTGAVLEALGGSAGSGSAVARARRGAVAYLRHDEDGDGGFADGPGAGSNAQSTAWAIQGLIAAGVAPASLRRDGHTPVSFLDSLVSGSGAVRYARGVTQTPVWVTGEALMALTGRPLPLVGRVPAVVSGRSAGRALGARRSRGARGSRAARRAPGGAATATGAARTTAAGAPGATDPPRARAAGRGSARSRHTTPRGARAGRARARRTRSRRAALTPAVVRMETAIARLPARVIAGVRLAGDR